MYSLYVGLQLLDPWRELWLGCLGFVGLVIIINELIAAYMRSGRFDEAQREEVCRYTLAVHAIFGHVILNVLACSLMIIYCIILEDPSVKLVDTTNNPFLVKALVKMPVGDLS